MATIIKRGCDCPRKEKARCAHKPHVVRYRDPSGDQREIGFKTHEAAEKFAVKVERDKDLGVYVDPRQGRRPFSEIWEEWKGWGDLELSTLANYGSVYRNHFQEHFGNKPIGSITVSDIAEWEQWQKSKGYKEYGIQVRRNVLSSVFGYAVNADIIGKNPCRKANPRKTSGQSAYVPVSDDDIPTLEEVLGIIAEAPKALRGAFWAMAGCGARPGEALALSDPSIEWESAVLLVNHQVSAHGLCAVTGSRRGVKRGTKHRKFAVSRRTPIPATVVEVLSDHIDRYGTWGDGWLFESPRTPGRHPSYEWLLRTFHDATKAAGVPQYTPKSFRHFFVSQALHGGVPPYEIAQWVGHRDSRTTEIVYGHLVKGAMKRGADAMESRLRGELGSFAGKVEPLALAEEDPDAAA